MSQRHKTLPEIPSDTAYICSPADVPEHHKVHLQDKEISSDICHRFEELCEEYEQAFSKHNEDSPPVSSRPYTLPLKHYEWVQKEIESLEHTGIITKNMSPWASPIVIGPKMSAPEEPLMC